MTQKPIAISCGEPAGIGPEIAVAAFHAIGRDTSLIWLGDPRHLPADTNHLCVENTQTASQLCAQGILPVIPIQMGRSATPGQPDPANAQGVIDAIAKGVALVTDGKARAICTAPIHKAALINGADFAYPGHTEYLAALAGVDRVVMMLACDALRVVPVTIHIPLADVSTRLTASLLTDTLLITHAALRRDFGVKRPRIAVAGLNPHAGEDGKMGMEEIDVITPVLDALRHEGMDLIGPMSADTMFHAAARQNYDVAVCMYHDQALIPVKTLGFDTGVNVTLGLPFIRTSPDHGTAFDIAGKGLANPSSMIEAIMLASKMADARDA
ncbi:4-hydroxythreonine-4-phosphate dehydrogenase PdxA [Yoonia sp.]|uniref:4-hydroxythreonine-4-phosphate dehydrogenase PdxA n=1 Tax=Yoonia sp. TaxID=2212373 RepID=UPI00238B8DF0|nr:4-hydroxythreonine-4-phosphate dehydrogenase PdxA [Yoonia sp.]MDE0851770.1 4-hydroxythreonine-4-phosphate dehydrogenase PdxA [Yoonia sp.]